MTINPENETTGTQEGGMPVLTNQKGSGKAAIFYCEELNLYVLANRTFLLQMFPQAHITEQGILELLG